MAEREQLLSQFVAWTRDHITGDEKGEAQVFLDRLFQAIGHPGSLDVGGSPEMRIRKAKVFQDVMRSQKPLWPYRSRCD